MRFDEELRGYLERGMTLQHRRLEWIRRLKNGEPYQNQYEERVKWRQGVPYKVRPAAPMLPATWDFLPNTSWDG
jgi:hypothetical protein